MQEAALQVEGISGRSNIGWANCSWGRAGTVLLLHQYELCVKICSIWRLWMTWSQPPNFACPPCWVHFIPCTSSGGLIITVVSLDRLIPGRLNGLLQEAKFGGDPGSESFSGGSPGWPYTPTLKNLLKPFSLGRCWQFCHLGSPGLWWSVPSKRKFRCKDKRGPASLHPTSGYKLKGRMKVLLKRPDLMRPFYGNS